MALSTQTRQLTEEMEKLFLVPFSFDGNATLIRDVLSRLPERFRGAGETFVDSLNSTLETTATPFILAYQAASDQHYQRISIAERIRARNIDPEPGETDEALDSRRDSEARAIASSKMAAFAESQEGIDVIVADGASFLIALHKSPNIQSVARELLLQGTVATWSALEMLVRDQLVLLVNGRPDLATNLQTDVNTRKRFEIPKLNIEDLASRGFDLSSQMGDLLLGERDFSSLPALKCACEALIDYVRLRDMLADSSLWRLNQIRHLIVHRRAIVDEEFRRKTGLGLKIGEKLCVSPDEFTSQMRLVLGIGHEFLIGLAMQLEL